VEETLTNIFCVVFYFNRPMGGDLNFKGQNMSKRKLVAIDPDYAGEYLLADKPGGRTRMMKPSQAVSLGHARVRDDGRTTEKIPPSEREQRFASG